MKPEIKALWVADLRNPENKQGHHTLRNDTGDCCLGRLCEVYRVQTGKGKWVEGLVNPRGHSVGKSMYFQTDTGDLEDIQIPFDVAQWAGLDGRSSGRDPVVRVPAEMPVPRWVRNALALHGDRSTALSNLNDGGLTFNQIATLIDQSL